MEKEPSHMSIRSQLGLKISHGINGGRCTLHFPKGCPPGVFSSSGEKNAIYQLLEILNQGRAIQNGLFQDTYLDYDRVLADRFIYIGSIKLEVNQRFHMAPFLQLPFDVVCTLRYIGKTSFSDMFELRNKADNHCLAKLYRQQIIVDPNARTPSEIPQHWRERYGKMLEGSRMIMKRLTKPQKCISESFHKIQSSDIDNQGHTNFLTFVKLCAKVSERAATEGKFNRFPGRTLRNGLKELQIRYENEALLGEEVIVHMWEAMDRDDQLCFEITRGPDVCIQASMTFHQTTINEYKFESTHSKL